jgi:hypothetical protein
MRNPERNSHGHITQEFWNKLQQLPVVLARISAVAAARTIILNPNKAWE